jgi:hypothetical protein
MYKKIGFFLSVLVVCFVSFSLNMTYGQSASSLQELQGQDIQQNSYRDELENYLVSHNMTVMNTQLKENPMMNVSTLDVSELEDLVKNHMQNCSAGLYALMGNIFNMTEDEISAIYGDCKQGR